MANPENAPDLIPDTTPPAKKQADPAPKKPLNPGAKPPQPSRHDRGSGGRSPRKPDDASFGDEGIDDASVDGGDARAPTQGPDKDLF